MLSEQTISHLLLIATQFCFSGWHIIGSQVLNDGADPLVFALYREITATMLMYGIIMYNLYTIRVDKEDWVRFFFLGTCSFTNVVGTVIALGYLSATRYAILQPSIPVWSCLISVFFGFEKLTVLKSAGILLAVSGAVLIDTWSEGSSDDDSSDILLGTVIVIVQCVAMASITVFQKPLLAKYPSPCVTFIYYSIGSMITVVMAICWVQRFTLYDFYFNGDSLPWIGLAYAAVFSTLFAYNVISWAGARLSPSAVTVYWTLQPVGTAVLSLIVWGRIITVPELVGGFLVGMGLIVTVIGRHKEQKQNPSADDILFRQVKINVDQLDMKGDTHVNTGSPDQTEPLLTSNISISELLISSPSDSKRSIYL